MKILQFACASLAAVSLAVSGCKSTKNSKNADSKLEDLGEHKGDTPCMYGPRMRI